MNLRREAVAEALGQDTPSSRYYSSRDGNIGTELDAENGMDISDLTGLEFAINLDNFKRLMTI